MTVSETLRSVLATRRTISRSSSTASVDSPKSKPSDSNIDEYMPHLEDSEHRSRSSYVDMEKRAGEVTTPLPLETSPSQPALPTSERSRMQSIFLVLSCAGAMIINVRSCVYAFCNCGFEAVGMVRFFRL
jgi:hypothetical protein